MKKRKKKTERKKKKQIHKSIKGQDMTDRHINFFIGKSTKRRNRKLHLQLTLFWQQIESSKPICSEIFRNEKSTAALERVR